MKLLRDLLFGCELKNVVGNTSISISSICCDSNEAKKSSLFVAVNGINLDGHTFISQSISTGAIAIVCRNLPIKKHNHVTYVQVADPSVSLGIIAANFFNNPSSKIKLIGITGTNGKTSIAHYLFSLFTQLNFKTGLISTIENRVSNKSFQTNHTTPNAIEINRLLSLMVDDGCVFCFMEVSSHGIMQNRISGLHFNIAVFSNLTRDHLDYHKSFSDYRNTKKRFFDNLPKDAVSIVNVDDIYANTMLLNTKSKKIFYGIKSRGHYTASILESSLSCLNISIDKKSISTGLIGDFNAYNLLAVYAVAHQLGQEPDVVLNLLSNLKPISGRFNIARSTSGIVGIVDYAHSPDALKKVIYSISNFCHPKKDLITVLGCGGNRDKGKRPIMGKIAFENSSIVIFTSDNPRFENPKDIVEDMCLQIPTLSLNKVHKIYNREEAISFAFQYAQKGSVVLVAGKGHEKFQEINGVKKPFDDYEIIKKKLNT